MTGELGLIVDGLNVSPADLAVDLVLNVVGALFAYRGAQRFKNATGVSPWRLPPGVWAVVVVLLSWVIGLPLFVIARWTTRPTGATVTQRAAPAWTTGAEHPDAQPPSGGTASGYGGSYAADARAVEHLPYAGWYHDPGGRHELRYWDGRGWTDYVSDAGVRSEDPD